MEAGWQAVQDNQQVVGVSNAVTVHPDGLSATDVTVTVAVSPSATEAIWFSDGLYGATAWEWNGERWRRVDTADVRMMMAPSLGPGEQATVTLPLAGSPPRVRVLVRTPIDGLGAWADVS